MSDVINLRRARKSKARAEKDRQAQANRTKHGVAKPARDLAKARDNKAARDLDAKRLERDKNGE
jgi:Domain of unknown function (DUF4169)